MRKCVAICHSRDFLLWQPHTLDRNATTAIVFVESFPVKLLEKSEIYAHGFFFPQQSMQSPSGIKIEQFLTRDFSRIDFVLTEEENS